MGVPGNADLLLLRSAAAAGGYTISRSLRFNSADSAYLSRTPASAGNRKTWTWAGWVKRSGLGTDQVLLDCRPVSSDSQFTIFYLKSGDTLELSGPVTTWRTTTQVFRDPSAWYHILLVLDTTQSTASDRIKIYVNGTQVTTFATSANPSQNVDLGINQSSLHCIAATSGGSPAAFFNGYLADIHFIDGQALTPSSFTETDLNGVLQPKAYSGSYGTNGFHLDFADNSNNTATTLGKDTSGAGNNWTPNNLSVTAGAGNDSLVDSPSQISGQTDSGAGGTVVGNYATLNPLDNPGNTLSNGNLDVAGKGVSFNGVRSTIGQSAGKWYFECTIVAETGETRTGPGLYRSTDALVGDYGNGTVVIYDYLGVLYVRDESGAGSTWYSTSGTVSAGDIFGFAFDLDAQKVWIHQNGTWLNSGNPGAGSGAVVSSLPAATYFPGGWAYSTSDNIVFNFGQRAFAYNSNRSGFKALCTANLPTPTIENGATAMDVKLYTGNGSTQTVSGLGFSPDFVWIKNRTVGRDHRLFDTVRGIEKELRSSATDAEATDANSVTAFTSSGFSVGSNTGINESSSAIVAWCWDAGTSTVTNTQGSITSQVRASASSGFAVISYTGTGSAGATIGHGLGVAPAFALFKNRSTSSDWQVYHSSLGNAQSILLQSTAAAGGSSAFNSTSPTSTVITLGAGTSLNNNGSNHVCYAFAPVAGYSSFGVVTATGTSDGGFAYTGFRPRFLLYKNASGTGNWGIYDSARDPENVCDNLLLPSSSSAEFTSVEFDLLSNGIKLRYPYTNGHQFVFAAFAEVPFQYARAR